MVIRINDPPSHYDIMRCLVGATLSTFPDKIEFRRDLDEQVGKIYDENSHPLLTKHRFNGFSGKGRNSIRRHPEDLIFDIISVYGGYKVGLSNWGLDYDFQIERATKRIGNMFLTGLDDLSEHAMGILGEKDFQHFVELGKKLRPKY